jgi:hypothetical protein
MANAAIEEFPRENRQLRGLIVLFSAALAKNAALNPANFDYSTNADGNRVVTEAEQW